MISDENGAQPMGMTVIEKILARASGAPKIAPGDLAVVDIDLSVLIDLSFSRGSWREVLKVHNPENLVVVFDHDVPASNRETAAMHVRGRDFVRRFGIRRFHDVGPDRGISHVVVAENAYCLPGTIMACSDSHTCGAGALNCAARGLGAPALLYAVTTGKTWFRVGETVRYDLEGHLGKSVSTKDVFLHIAGSYGDHANQNVEFGGAALPRCAAHADDNGCGVERRIRDLRTGRGADRLRQGALPRALRTAVSRYGRRLRRPPHDRSFHAGADGRPARPRHPKCRAGRGGRGGADPAGLYRLLGARHARRSRRSSARVEGPPCRARCAPARDAGVAAHCHSSGQGRVCADAARRWCRGDPGGLRRLLRRSYGRPWPGWDLHHRLDPQLQRPDGRCDGAHL